MSSKKIFFNKIHLWAVASGVLVVALAGCGTGGDSESAQRASEQTIKNDANTAKGQLDQVRGVTMKGGELSGGDAKGRPLWRVKAARIKVFNEAPVKEKNKRDDEKDGEGKSDKSAIAEIASQPKRAELIDATAILYNEGKPESNFRSPRIILKYTPDGVRLSMMGGVTVQTTGEHIGKRGPVTITAPRAEVDIKARRLWAGKGVRLVQGEKEQRVDVIADQLTANSNLQVTTLSGGVKSNAPQGQFEARTATWNWQTSRVSAQGGITATQDDTVLKGARLDADTAAGRGVLSGGITANGKQGNATASSIRYDWKAHTLSATGGVKLTKDKTIITAGSISADDKFESAVASGGVMLIKGDAKLRASRVTTQGKGESATAGGNVVLTRDNSTLSASSATAHNIGEKNAYVTASGSVRVKRGDVTVTAGKAQASGLGDKNSLRVIASNGVTATGKDGTVRASNVTWGGGRVLGSGNVTLLRDGNRLSGDKLEADDKFTKATLSGDINGKLAGGETITAGKLLYEKGRIYATGGVSARKADLSLRADRMEATPGADHILLTGHVTITNQDGVKITSSNARYDRKAQKVYASGKVFLTDTKRGLRQQGTGLVADLKLKQATLTGITGSGKMDVFKDKKLF